MKNRILIFAVVLLSTLSINAQTEPFQKGDMMFFWGYNRAVYANSDIHFKGNNYDFTLQNVQARDRQTPFRANIYFNINKITVPQVNYRLSYFIADNLSITLGMDHMKYVMVQNQTADFKGYIGNPTYAAFVVNNKVDLTSGQFLQFEHTDGLNYANVGIQKYKHLLNHAKFDIFFGYGGGVGVMVPKSNVTLMGFERSDRYHIAGFGLDARSSINFVVWNHLVGQIEAKAGYINLPDIKTTLNDRPDKASQDFAFAQVNFGLGYTFRTKKKL